jgi:hypothetical protein
MLKLQNSGHIFGILSAIGKPKSMNGILNNDKSKPKPEITVKPSIISKTGNLFSKFV